MAARNEEVNGTVVIQRLLFECRSLLREWPSRSRPAENTDGTILSLCFDLPAWFEMVSDKGFDQIVGKGGRNRHGVLKTPRVSAQYGRSP